MRGVAIVLSLLLTVPGGLRAEVIDMPSAPPPDPERGNFWRDMLWPHKDEVDVLVMKARQTVITADQLLFADYDPSGTERMRFYRAAYGPLRYARKLAPDNLDVLRLLGQVADEQGKTREALDALHAAVDLVGVERAGNEVTGRLGIIYVRLGNLDEAIRYLRHAQSYVIGGQMMTAHVLVHLAHALAARGQMSDALDVLANSITPNLQYYSNEIALVSLALAVHYDRDDQRGAAFEVLERMSSTLQGQIANSGQGALAAMRFSPAADRHYYYGLLYEAAGNLSEARAEFALYAAAGELPYRRRALEHVAAIDELRRRGPTATPAQIRPFTPPPVHRRRHHP